MNVVKAQWHKLSPAVRNLTERTFWTAVQAAFAVVIVSPFHDWDDVRTALVAALAAGITAVKVVVQQLLAARAAEAGGIHILDPDAPGQSQTTLEQATPQNG